MTYNIMNNFEQSNIEKNVMRRVHLLRILGLIISTGMLAALTFVVALWGVGKEVWVERVFSNGPQDFIGHLNYLLYAFGHTRLIVQVLSLLSVASFVFLIRECVRTFSSIFANEVS
ncbi:MAG: hypothetical protein NTU85_03385 [Candidatus Kaiserbacteria bacterium]|nr:hypothetical protein [Candidatus Kaiserbacteria bacterium]